MIDFTYSWNQLEERHPAVAKAVLKGQRRGHICDGDIPHVGSYTRRWYFSYSNGDEYLVVENAWNNDDSDFDYYAKGE